MLLSQSITIQYTSVLLEMLLDGLLGQLKSTENYLNSDPVTH